MKKHDLFDAIGNVDDKYLKECESEQIEATYQPAGVLKAVGVAAGFVLIFAAMAILPRLLFGNIKPQGPSADESVGEISVSESETQAPEPPVEEHINNNIPAPVEVIDAYGEATKAANWFRLSQYGLEIDSNDSVTIDNMPYYRVTSFETYDKFIEYLNSLFEKGITHMFIETSPNFKEYDGNLYLAPADGGSNICIGGETLLYRVVNDRYIELTARVDINAVADVTNPDPKNEVIGTEDVVFPYELIGDKWVFTDFPDIDAINTDKYIGTAVKTNPELYHFFECGGMTLILPKRFEENYSVLHNSPEALGLMKPTEGRSDAAFYDSSMLFEVYFMIPGEADKFHEIFRIARYTPGDYERNILASIVARREVLGYDGEYYYVMHYPSSGFVVSNEDSSLYYSTVNACETAARLLFGKYNELEEASPTDFYQQTYTYEGNHKYYRYYPYGTENEDKLGTYYTLVLSQPADQGADGIWCVERLYTSPGDDGRGYIQPQFPNSGDLSAKEFYENLQRKVSAGQTAVPMKYLDPLSAAINFVWDTIGHDFADASYFIEVDGLPEGEYNY